MPGLHSTWTVCSVSFVFRGKKNPPHVSMCLSAHFTYLFYFSILGLSLCVPSGNHFLNSDCKLCPFAKKHEWTHRQKARDALLCVCACSMMRMMMMLQKTMQWENGCCLYVKLDKWPE